MAKRNYDELLDNPNDLDAPPVGSPEALIEDGLALVARGIFRTNQQQGIDAACDAAASVSSTTSALHLDFLRLKQRRKCR